MGINRLGAFIILSAGGFITGSDSGVTFKVTASDAVDLPATALPRMGADTLRGCVKLGVPVCLGATSCVSRRVSERRTPSVPHSSQSVGFIHKKHHRMSEHIRMMKCS
ncbi:hypothetical protein [Hafnia alvei]|uniref:hypothetical protein n=1 Tax=Hafnia alvei TaxID=569 RepID=UPI0024A7F390|nr:hypothetical protein [Hafnia alvei]